MKKQLCNISAVALILLSTHSAACAFYLPATGQSKCYRAVSPFDEISCSGTGQDGEYSINPISYIDNGNGTVTDYNTGLMWQKCSVGQNDDTACSGTATTYTWASAQIACEGLSLGGKSDWRVPSKKELISIVDYSVPFPGPTLMDAYFPNTIAGSSSVYWTSTQLASDTTKALYTTFDYGNAYNASKTTSYYVRCVRGDATAQSFTAGNGTVTDNRTGLVWQKCSTSQDATTCSGSGTRYTWNDALNYCNNLSLANQTDWRLPNAKELESLTDDTKYNPSIDTQYFPNTNYPYYWWSSTTYAGSPNYAWYVAFGGGSVVGNLDTKDFYLNVRCVRGGASNPAPKNFRLLHGNSVTPYSAFHDAYVAALDGDTIEAQAIVSTQNLTCDSASDSNVWLKGGYDSEFASNTGFTIIGSLIISGGGVTLENFIIQ